MYAKGVSYVVIKQDDVQNKLEAVISSQQHLGPK